jgi:hypothetical protein
MSDHPAFNPALPVRAFPAVDFPRLFAGANRHIARAVFQRITDRYQP